MKIYGVKTRTPRLMAELLKIWEASVRATHDFLSEAEIVQIKEYVPQALEGVKHLMIAEESGRPVAFMGIEDHRLEMLFLSPEERGKGIGKKLIRYGIAHYGIREVTVNEQNTQAAGFYEHLGFKTYKRTPYDEEGNPYPLFYMKRIAYYHLPGLFEFYELYRRFLPLYCDHREYFYDWCEIGSVYGAPADCIWGGGRVENGTQKPEAVLALMREYNISARLTFSNSLLQREHLADPKCNALCRMFEKSGEGMNGVIVHSELLTEYLKEHYPGLYLVSSTTKVLTDFDEFLKEVDREEFRYVVPDFRLNKSFDRLEGMTGQQKDKAEFLCNECCYYGCQDRKSCYENVSRQNLEENCPDHHCSAPDAQEGYRFSKAMAGPGFIGIQDINDIYLPMGFSNFKIEGRGLGSALILEFLLYYMTKPEYQIHVREEMYLDNMLDLF